MYKERRKLIPPNPKTMTDLNVDLPMFQYTKDESVVKGDQVLSDGRRVVLFTTNAHLKLLSKTEEMLADGTFRITRESYDSMFSMLAEILESQGLEMSATYFMSGN